MSARTSTTKRPVKPSKLNKLLAFDRKLIHETANEYQKQFLGTLGVDEVGRGSLVGPVVAAALILPPELTTVVKKRLRELDDSKAPHFTHDKRMALAADLKEIGFWGIGEASLAEIETLNIFHASYLAATRAIQHLNDQYCAFDLSQYLVIIDGKFKIPNLTFHQSAVIKADGCSASVAGASIIAKAHRDDMLIKLAQDYPGYGWETNAGYGTPAHQKAMRTLGCTPLHRKTYKLVRDAMDCLASAQTTLPLETSS